jgi:hypothetical protein
MLAVDNIIIFSPQLDQDAERQ